MNFIGMGICICGGLLLVATIILTIIVRRQASQLLNIQEKMSILEKRNEENILILQKLQNTFNILQDIQDSHVRDIAIDTFNKMCLEEMQEMQYSGGTDNGGIVQDFEFPIPIHFCSTQDNDCKETFNDKSTTTIMEEISNEMPSLTTTTLPTPLPSQMFFQNLDTSSTNSPPVILLAGNSMWVREVKEPTQTSCSTTHPITIVELPVDGEENGEATISEENK